MYSISIIYPILHATEFCLFEESPTLPTPPCMLGYIVMSMQICLPGLNDYNFKHVKKVFEVNNTLTSSSERIMPSSSTSCRRHAPCSERSQEHSTGSVFRNHARSETVPICIILTRARNYAEPSFVNSVK